MAIPISLDDAKRQLRMDVEDTSQDEEISGFVMDAAEWVEGYTGHILEARDVTEHFRGFRPVSLRAWPIKPDAIPGVAYADAAGLLVAVVGARLDLSRRPARVLPPLDVFWPFRDDRQLFSVTIRAGYEPEDAVPADLARAMLILISAYDADREGGDLFQKAEATARRLCDRHRLYVV